MKLPLHCASPARHIVSLSGGTAKPSSPAQDDDDVIDAEVRDIYG